MWKMTKKKTEHIKVTNRNVATSLYSLHETNGSICGCVYVHKDIIASFSVTRNQSHACYSVDLKLFVEFYTNKFSMVDQMFAISFIQAELIHLANGSEYLARFDSSMILMFWFDSFFHSDLDWESKPFISIIPFLRSRKQKTVIRKKVLINVRCVNHIFKFETESRCTEPTKSKYWITSN